MNRSQKLSPRIQIVLVAVGLLVILLLGYFLLVSSEKGKASSLSKQIDATNAQILQARALSQPVAADPADPRRDAVPAHEGDAERDRHVGDPPPAQPRGLAGRDQLRLDHPGELGRCSPATRRSRSTLTFTGNYYGLVDFLLRLRNLVDVQNGELDANGRLFAVDTITFGEATTGFPQITANARSWTRSSTGPAAPASATGDATATAPRDDDDLYDHVPDRRLRGRRADD